MSAPATPTNSKVLYAKLKEALAAGKFAKTVKKLGKDLIRIKDELGQTVLHLAASEGNVAFFQELLEGKDAPAATLMKTLPGLLEEKDKNDWRPLHCATSAGELQIVALLVKHGADVSAPTIEDATCLHYLPKIQPPSASNSGAAALYLETVRTIVDKTTNINLTNKRGQTALHRAAAEGLAKRGQLIHALLSKDCDLNIRDGIGETPLHAACRIGDEGLISLLLTKGADITICGENGTPLQIAAQEKHTSVVNMLKRWAKEKGIKLTETAAPQTSSVQNTEQNEVFPQSKLLAERRDAIMPKDPPELQQERNAKRRLNVVKELIETEKTHVKTLTDLTSVFLDPLMHKDTMEERILSNADLQQLCPEYISLILETHNKILSQLKRKMRNWSDSQTVADAFTALAPQTYTFKSYAVNIETSIDFVKRMVSQAVKAMDDDAASNASSTNANTNASPSTAARSSPITFLKFLHTRNSQRNHRQSMKELNSLPRSDSRGMEGIQLNSAIVGGGMASATTALSGVAQYMDDVNEFIALLVAPLARIARYTQLLRDLLQFTPADHPDFKNTESALEIADKIAHIILEAKAASIMRTKILNIADSISGYTEALYKPERELVKDGPVNVKGRSKNQTQWISAHLYLFNDLLLWAKKVQPDKANNNKSLQFIRSVPLKNLTALRSLDAEGKNVFEISLDKGDKEVFQAENEEQRHSWMSAIAAGASTISPTFPWRHLRAKGQAPTPRASATLCTIGNRHFLFGGNFRSTYYDDMHILALDSDQKRWITVENRGGVWPSPRSEHTAIVLNDKMYVFGGFDGKKRLNDLYCFDPKTMQWSVPTVTGTVPAERSGHAMALGNNGRIYVYGGIDSNGTYLNDLFMLTVDGNTATWSLVMPEEGSFIPQARAYHTMVALNEYLVVFGGYSFTKCFDDCEVFDTEESVWVKFSSTPTPCATSSSGSAVVEKTTSSASLDTSSLSAESHPPARHAHSAFVYNNVMFIYGGSSFAGNQHFCDMWCMTLNNHEIKWTKVPMALQLESRHRHALTAVMQSDDNPKSYAVVFGGLVGVTTNPTYRNDVVYFRNLKKLSQSHHPLASSSSSSSTINTPRSKTRERGSSITSSPVTHSVSKDSLDVLSSSSSSVPSPNSLSSSMKKSKHNAQNKSSDTPVMSAHRKPNSPGPDDEANTASPVVDISTSNLSDLISTDAVIYSSSANLATADVVVHSAVYGKDSSSPPSLAVKIIRNCKLNDTLKNEFMVLRDLYHPNLVQYYGATEKDGDIWMLMDLQLTSVLQLAKTVEHVFTEPQIATIARAMLCAIIYLNSQKLSCRHLRADNILISEDGIIKLANYAMTEPHRTEKRHGKRAELSDNYIAPEDRPGTSQKELHAKGASPEKSDVWALAVTLITLSESHFDDDSDDASDTPPKSTRSHRKDPPSVTHRSSLSTSERFIDFISKCLVPQPSQRADPQSLLNHRFITENCPHPLCTDSTLNGIPSVNSKQDILTFNDVLLAYKKKRKRRSMNPLAQRHTITDVHKWAVGITPTWRRPSNRAPSTVSHKAQTEGSSQSRKSNDNDQDQPKHVETSSDTDSPGHKHKKSTDRKAVASSGERVEKGDPQPEDASKQKPNQAGKIAKMEQQLDEVQKQLAEKDRQIEELQKKIADLLAREAEHSESKIRERLEAELRERITQELKAQMLASAQDKSNTADASKSTDKSESVDNAAHKDKNDGSDATKRSSVETGKPTDKNDAADNAGRDSVDAAKADDKKSPSDTAKPKDKSGSVDSANPAYDETPPRRPSESTLNALSLEKPAKAGDTSALKQTPPVTSATRYATLRGPTLSRRRVEQSAYAVGNLPRPSLVTNKSRIMDRIMLFESAAAANAQSNTFPSGKLNSSATSLSGAPHKNAK